MDDDDSQIVDEEQQTHKCKRNIIKQQIKDRGMLAGKALNSLKANICHDITVTFMMHSEWSGMCVCTCAGESEKRINYSTNANIVHGYH